MSLYLQKFFSRTNNCNGFALVLVLAFVVLLTGIALAFLSNSLLQRQVSNSSANIAAAGLLADGAVDTTIGDLKKEIEDGSTKVSVVTGGVTSDVYAPKSSTGGAYANNVGAFTTMLPCTQGFSRPGTPGATNGLENLVKVSTNAPFYQGGAYAGAGPTRAANSPTTSGSRPIALARWNKPLFLAATSTSDLTPSATGFPTPNWIYVSSNGGNPQAPDASVVGRYAYTIYDEGGLLDVNVAGYPSSMAPTTATPDVTYKSAEAYADLTQIGLKQTQIDQIVNWRNQATLSTTDGYKNYIASNSTGFLKVGSTSLSGNVSDRMFVGRQQFIDFLKNKVSGFDQQTQDALQYLTTFSRGLNQPSYIRLQSTNQNKATAAIDFNSQAPKVLPLANGGNSAAGSNADDQINPTFLGVRVANRFTRNDGTSAEVGEPLVKKRFALSRLAWLTYKGPSAERNTAATETTGSDGDIGLLKQNGITEAWLKQGTRENIQKYFGLTWGVDSDGNACWEYNVHNGTSGAGPTGAIMKLGEIASLGTPHEPDFFELLKAAVNVGSIGKALLPSGTAAPADPGGSQDEQPYNFNYYTESSVDIQIIQVGANIISQYQTSNYPARIIFDDGTGARYMPRTIAGVSNLPYLESIMVGALQIRPPSPLPSYASGATITTPGIGALMQLPVLWNPCDPSSSMGALGAGPTNFRVVADSASPFELKMGTHNRYCVYSRGSGVASYAAASSSPSSWYKDSGGTGISISHQLTADNTAILFSVLSGNKTAFPEPTMLVRPKLITDLNGNRIQVNTGPLHLIRNDPALASAGVSGTQGGLPNYFANALNMNQPSEPQDPAGTAYLGFYLGAFPMAWNYSGSSSAGATSVQDGGDNGIYWARAGLPPTTESCYMTYRVQYADPINRNNWVTYDTKYGNAMLDRVRIAIGQPSLICGNRGGANDGEGFWAAAVDPRSSRFGLFWNGTSNWEGNYTPVVSAGLPLPLPGPELYRSTYSDATFTNATGWLDTASGALYTVRDDAQSGYYFMKCWPTAAGQNTGWMAWIGCNSQSFAGIAPGLLSENNTDIFYVPSGYYGAPQGAGSHTPNYFADPDGMVRRAMGAFVPLGNGGSPSYDSVDSRKPPSADTTVGLPMARVFDWNRGTTYRPPTPDPCINVYNPSSIVPTTQAQSRPYFLHRPFRSVAELGYVFSDTPWRNLDFSTAESGNVALLDVFCINDPDNADGLVAGKVDLNTNQVPVLEAILSKSYLDSQQLGTGAATDQINLATATTLADALVARTSDITTNGAGPLRNIADLVGRFVARENINDLGGLITGSNKGTLSASNGFYDGKLSYTGFSGGDWDAANHKAKTSIPVKDVYSAAMSANQFSSNSHHSGSRETAAYIQRFREAPIRALTAIGQTRVWNLMIDMVAQTGRFPQNSRGLNSFMPSGERRYWVHLAIDRMTGKVIDKQVEVVKE